jgi:hypothetical protein
MLFKKYWKLSAPVLTLMLVSACNGGQDIEEEPASGEIGTEIPANEEMAPEDTNDSEMNTEEPASSETETENPSSEEIVPEDPANGDMNTEESTIEETVPEGPANQ